MLRAGLAWDVILQLVRDVQHGEVAAKDEYALEPAAGAAPMEEEESKEEAGQEQGQGQGQGDVAMAPINTAEPTVTSAMQAFNNAWMASSVITSMDPMAYTCFAVPLFPQPIPGVGIIRPHTAQARVPMHARVFATRGSRGMK